MIENIPIISFVSQYSNKKNIENKIKEMSIMYNMVTINEYTMDKFVRYLYNTNTCGNKEYRFTKKKKRKKVVELTKDQEIKKFDEIKKLVDEMYNNFVLEFTYAKNNLRKDAKNPIVNIIEGSISKRDYDIYNSFYQYIEYSTDREYREQYEQYRKNIVNEDFKFLDNKGLCMLIKVYSDIYDFDKSMITDKVNFYMDADEYYHVNFKKGDVKLRSSMSGDDYDKFCYIFNDSGIIDEDFDKKNRFKVAYFENKKIKSNTCYTYVINDKKRVKEENNFEETSNKEEIDLKENEYGQYELDI